MDNSILNPVRTVQLRAQAVDVSELTWKDYLRAVKMLASTVSKLLTPDGKVNSDPAAVVSAIADQEALASFVVSRATKRDEKWVEQLSLQDMLTLLTAVVEMNLTEEIIGTGKALAGRMGGILTSKKPLPGQQTTSSGPADTASAT